MAKGTIVGYAVTDDATHGPHVVVAAPDVGAAQPAAAGGKPADQTRGLVRRRS